VPFASAERFKSTIGPFAIGNGIIYPLQYRSVQLAKICGQCFQVILLQIHRCHSPGSHLDVWRMKERDQLGVGIFLANAYQRTGGCCSYPSFSVAGVA
jgi:hypothetical protein